MIDTDDKIVFHELLRPLIPHLKKEADALKKDADTYKLSLYFFTLNLLYGCIKRIKSISLLATEIKTSPEASALDFVAASQSMYSEAFVCYDPAIFRRLFHVVLERLDFLEVPEIRALGRLLCIDGSVFPALSTMDWAHYQKSSNAIKIHLAFELNRMLPVQFLTTAANSSEIKALREILEAGVTSIADRGYVSFSLFHTICEQQAYFVIRTKTNLKYLAQEVLTPYVPPQWSAYVLLLHFKQRCALDDDQIPQPLQPDERPDEHEPNTASRCLPESRVPPACGVVSLLGGKLHRY